MQKQEGHPKLEVNQSSVGRPCLRTNKLRKDTALVELAPLRPAAYFPCTTPPPPAPLGEYLCNGQQQRSDG